MARQTYDSTWALPFHDDTRSFSVKSASHFTCFVTLALLLVTQPTAFADDLAWIGVSPDKSGFVAKKTDTPFVPWGVNYDHDADSRLLEDYWETEWSSVEQDFREMRDLGFNTVRIHLQFGKFMTAADTPNRSALAQLQKLLKLAEQTRLYLDLTGLGCYHKQDVPAWYDALSEAERWQAQARFWEAIAKVCADSPAVFCYDLMNEPVVPGGKRTDGDWLGPAFAGKHFVQFITLDQNDRPRPEIARQWVTQLCSAIRRHDSRHLITVGLVPWSLQRPGLTSGFVPDKIAEPLDFVAVHIYPESGKLDDALETLKGFNVGKPVIIEEYFPLKCSLEEAEQFIRDSRGHTHGWISFYWGKTIAESKASSKFADQIIAAWLERFQELGPEMQKNVAPERE